MRDRAIGITMRKPDHDDELAAGFLLTERIVLQPADTLRIEPCAKNELGNASISTLTRVD